MIEEAESETYYYHYDALGSVVALSDQSGDTVQTYQYSVFGQVAASDDDFPNPYMFAGRRFDIEIGLYYYRARYYNPFMGRFLQTDPIVYEDGMNMYAYCKNNPVNRADPLGELSSSDAEELVSRLAIVGGLWAGRIEKPAYPGNWTSWIDFFGWYAHGEGETIDLRKAGLISNLRNHKKVKDWEKEVRDHADDMGKALAKQILWIGMKECTITYPASKQFDFGGSTADVLIDVVTGLVAPSLSDPLVVLGDFTINATITVKAWRDPVNPNKAYWSRIIEYSLNDSFSDPGDLLDQVPGAVEWVGCQPYDIKANWTSVNGGSVIGPTASQ
jgi:RHS repeat-associated protein